MPFELEEVEEEGAAKDVIGLRIIHLQRIIGAGVLSDGMS